jgi:hypothetical protein
MTAEACGQQEGAAIHTGALGRFPPSPPRWSDWHPVGLAWQPSRMEVNTRFVLVEVYGDDSALAEHKKTAHYQTWHDTVAEMMPNTNTCHCSFRQYNERRHLSPKSSARRRAKRDVKGNGFHPVWVQRRLASLAPAGRGASSRIRLTALLQEVIRWTSAHCGKRSANS